MPPTPSRDGSGEPSGRDFGRLDILVNNAGLFLPRRSSDATMAGYDAMFNVNVRGLYAATSQRPGTWVRAVGSLTSAASMATAFRSPGSGLHGIQGGGPWTDARVRPGFGSARITINTLQPGPVDTDMNPDNTELPRS